MDPTPGYDLFLSYSRRDRGAAETLAARLIHEAGLRLWMDRARLRPGASWRDEIEQAMNAASAAVITWGPEGLGPVQRQERDLAYALRDARPSFRVVYALLPGAPPPQGTWANVDTWVRFEGGLDEGDPFARLVAALRGEAPPGALEATLPNEPAPYRGLAAFGFGDELFFGRLAIVEELCERLARHPFLAVVGASGCGKTSLVQAGVLTRLAAEKEPAGKHVRPIVVRPGPHPLQSLAAELARLREVGDRLVVADDLRQRLAADPMQLPYLIQALLPVGERAALVVDRLEEIYTLAESEEEVERFVSALLALARHPHQPALLLLTLRADFYARLARHPDLAAEVASRQVFVTPLSEAEIAEAIEAPSAVVGAVFEKGLAARVRDDVRQRGEVVLPLLQHALDLLWKKRRGRWLTWETYDEIGQVQGALRYQADRVIESLSGDEQAIARQLLTRLVWIEEGAATAIAGRRVAKDQLVKRDGALEERVLQHLADERLVQLRGGARATVELIHDSLALHWERLKGWVNEDREFLLWRQRLQADLAEWERTGRDEGILLRGAPLVEAERWTTERRDNLSLAEKDLVAASVALCEREIADRERLRRRVMTGLVAGLILASGLALLAAWQWRQAETQRRVALSRQLAALAGTEPIERLDRVLLLATEAYKSADTFEARGALLAGLTEAQSLAAFLYTGQGEFDGPIAFSPDGKVFAAALKDGNRIGRWDVATRQPIGEALVERTEVAANHNASPSKPVTELAFGPDGRTLAVVRNGTFGVTLWDLTADPPVGQRMILEDGDPILKVAISPDRHRLALLRRESVIVWDLFTRRQVGEPIGVPASGPTGAGQYQMKEITFAPDNKRLLLNRLPNGVILVTIETPRPYVETLAEGDLVTSAAWSDDGELALGTNAGAIRRYALASHAEIAPPLAGSGGTVRDRFGPGRHRAPIVGLSYTREGKNLVAVDNAGAISLWDRSSHAPAARPGGNFKDFVYSATFSPDGQSVIVAEGNESELWRMLDGQKHPPLPIGGEEDSGFAEALWSDDGSTVVVLRQHGARILTMEPNVTETSQYKFGSVSGMAFSSDGVTLAIRDQDGRISLWNLSEDEALRRSLPSTKWNFLPSAAWSPDGRQLAWGTAEIALWDVGAGRPLPPLGAGKERTKGMEEEVSALSFSPDGRMLASGRSDGAIRLWNAVTRTQVGPLLAAPEKAPVTGIAFSPDGQRVVVGGSESDIALRDLRTRRWIERPSAMSPGTRPRFKLPEDTRLGLAVSPTRPVAALAVGDPKVALVDLDSGKPVKRLNAPSPVYSVAFHPKGDVLATGGIDGAVLLWDVVSGERLGAPLTISENVESLSFDQIGNRLAIGSSDGSKVVIWDLVRRQRLLPTLTGHPGAAKITALSPDGKKLFTASSDTPPLLWDLDIAAWPARACRIANRNLTREEWRQAFGENTPYRKTCSELPGPPE